MGFGIKFDRTRKGIRPDAVIRLSDIEKCIPRPPEFERPGAFGFRGPIIETQRPSAVDDDAAGSIVDKGLPGLPRSRNPARFYVKS